MESETRLAYLIRKNGISVNEISERTDIPKASLTKYMAGTSVPNVYNAIKIANFLGVKVEDIW